MLKLRLPIPVFRNAKEIVNGVNSRMALKGLVASRAALVISDSFRNSDHYSQITRLINAESLKVFSKTWAGEPNLDDISSLVRELEIFKPDYIIALGGGSVIDGAKLAWLFYEHPLSISEDIFRPFSSPPLRGRAKFAAIPTTIGSGSEVSSAAVMFDEKSISKKAVVTHDFLPDLVILDPELVMDVPKPILRTTVADALSHAVEGYVSKINHHLMDIFAEKSIQLIYKNKGYINGDGFNLYSIQELQYASMLAGLVQNHCIVGMSHAIAHQLGAYKIGHGLANGILMPKVIDFNSKNKNVSDRYVNLCINSGIKNIEDLKNIFDELVSDAKLQLNIRDDELDVICDLALNDPAAKVNPVLFNSMDVREIINQCL